MHPALGLGVPTATGGDEVQVGIVLTITPVGVQDDDVAAFESLPAEVAKEFIHTADPTSHQLAQQGTRVVIEGVPQHVGEGKDGMAIDLSEGSNYQKETVLSHNTPTLIALFPSHNFGLLQAL